MTDAKDKSVPASMYLRGEHTADDRYSLLQIYGSKRLNGQREYYANRLHEFKVNSDLTFTLGLGLTGLGTILAALGAVLVGFQQIYDWERQSALYEDAKRGLKQINDNLFLDENNPPNEWKDELINTVKTTESILQTETDQWGQPAFDTTPQSLDDFIRSYTKQRTLTDEQRKKIDDLMTQVRKIVEAKDGG